MDAFRDCTSPRSIVYVETMRSLKELRIQLGQTQDLVAERAHVNGNFPQNFSRDKVLYAEKGIGLSVDENVAGIAAGLGMNVETLRAYMDGAISLADAVARSSIRPDPKEGPHRRRGLEQRREHRRYEGKLVNLQATLDWCAGQYPEAFLFHVGRVLGASSKDRSRAEWYQRIQVRFLDWKERHRAGGRSVPQDELDEMPMEQVPQQRKLGRPKARRTKAVQGG